MRLNLTVLTTASGSNANNWLPAENGSQYHKESHATNPAKTIERLSMTFTANGKRLVDVCRLPFSLLALKLRAHPERTGN